jgi:hypothetical protein
MQTTDTPAAPAALAQGGGIWRGLVRAAHAPWFAYLTLALLQLRVVWGAWDYRDLTAGDTAAYYVLAHSWEADLKVNIVWSPLYTVYYGTALWLFPDVWAATLAHRLVIVFATSLLVLAVLRRLLPPGLAWLAAAWWAMLPINFNTLYEVHLFSALPVFGCWLLLLSARGPWGRACGLGLLGLAAVLVRNELAVAFGLTALLCLAWELGGVFRGGPSLWRRLFAYTLTLAATAGLCLGAYARSMVKGRDALAVYRGKHTVNMAQVYSVGYQQRHPEWTKNPWTEGPELMRAHFGKDFPTLTEMLRANRRAVLRHFRWNAQLVPNGLELLLFNATGSSVNPDYIPVALRRPWAHRLGLLALALLVAGAAVCAWQWRRWWAGWLRERAGGWLAIAAMLPAWALIIATQRPRPSYLFPLGLALMAAIGTAVHVLLSQWPVGRRRLAALAPLVMLALCLLVRPHYLKAGPPPAQRCRAAVERMRPFEKSLTRTDVTLLHGEFLDEVFCYVGKSKCRALGYDVIHRRPRDVPLEVHLAREKVDFFQLNEQLLRFLEADPSPAARGFLGPTAPPGWELVGRGDAPGDRWRVFRRL